MARKINTKKTKHDASKFNLPDAPPPTPQTKPGNNAQMFWFAAPAAVSVQLVGDFTHWQEKPVNLQKSADGIWRTSVELTPGRHHYRFLVDGQWRDDPECRLRTPNPFGGEDMIRQVATE